MDGLPYLTVIKLEMSTIVNHTTPHPYCDLSVA